MIAEDGLPAADIALYAADTASPVEAVDRELGLALGATKDSSRACRSWGASGAWVPVPSAVDSWMCARRTKADGMLERNAVGVDFPQRSWRPGGCTRERRSGRASQPLA